MSIAMSCEELTVVVVDDDMDHRNLIRAALESDCECGKSISILEYEEPDLALASLPPEGNVVVLVDYNLNGASGLDWIQDFARTSMGPVIIMTSSGDEDIAAKAFRMGAADYLDKGDVIRNPMELWDSINRSIRRFKLEKTNRTLARSLKLANAELSAKNEKLAILTQNAQQFVEDVAHEFRTPLTVIKEFASIIADGIGGEVSAKQLGYLEFISEATGDLANLVDDFLDSGKLRTGMLRVHRRSHAPEKVIDSAWRMIETRAAAKSIAVERVVPSQLPDVFVDAEKAGRALLNLVTNAIKFTDPDGTIKIHVVPCPGAVRFEVEDQGPGLTPEEIENLFQRFHQCDRAHQITEKGFGLGLSIVRDLVCINLGAVEIWSRPGEGSVFSFTVPTDDIDSIVSGYMDRAQDREPGVPVTAIRVTHEDDTNELDADFDFLCSVCYGTDVVMKSPDGQSILLLGQTAKSGRWIERLRSADRNRRANFDHGDSRALHFEVIGMWHADEDRGAVCKVLGHKAPGAEHGTHGSDR